jgi:hypothetical protein
MVITGKLMELLRACAPSTVKNNTYQAGERQPAAVARKEAFDTGRAHRDKRRSLRQHERRIGIHSFVAGSSRTQISSGRILVDSGVRRGLHLGRGALQGM